MPRRPAIANSRDADVLLVDDAVGQGDPPAEPGGEAAGLPVVTHQREQASGAATGIRGDARAVTRSGRMPPLPSLMTRPTGLSSS